MYLLFSEKYNCYLTCRDHDTLQTLYPQWSTIRSTCILYSDNSHGWVRSLDLTAHTSLFPKRRRFAPSFVNYTRFAAAIDEVYQLLAQGRWFSPSTLTCSTTKTGRHDIAEILLKVALNTNKSINQSIIERANHIYHLETVQLYNVIYQD